MEAELSPAERAIAIRQEVDRMKAINDEYIRDPQLFVKKQEEEAKKNNPVQEPDNIHYWLHKDDFSKKFDEFVQKHRKAIVGIGLTALAIMGGVLTLNSGCNSAPQPTPEPSPTPLIPTPTAEIPTATVEPTATAFPTSTPTPEPTATPSESYYDRQWTTINLEEGKSPYKVVRDLTHAYFPDIKQGSAMENALAMYGADLWTVYNNFTPAQSYNLNVGLPSEFPSKPVMQVGKDCFAGDKVSAAPDLTSKLCTKIYTMEGYPLDDRTNDIIDPAAIFVEKVLREEVFVDP